MKTKYNILEALFAVVFILAACQNYDDANYGVYSNIPEVITEDVIDITDNSVTLKEYKIVTDPDTAAKYRLGYVLSESETFSDTIMSFATRVLGLAQKTTYYYKAVLHLYNDNESWNNYHPDAVVEGDVKSFTTSEFKRKKRILQIETKEFFADEEKYDKLTFEYDSQGLLSTYNAYNGEYRKFLWNGDTVFVGYEDGQYAHIYRNRPDGLFSWYEGAPGLYETIIYYNDDNHPEIMDNIWYKTTLTWNNNRIEKMHNVSMQNAQLSYESDVTFEYSNVKGYFFYIEKIKYWMEALAWTNLAHPELFGLHEVSDLPVRSVEMSSYNNEPLITEYSYEIDEEGYVIQIMENHYNNEVNYESDIVDLIRITNIKWEGNVSN